MLVLEDVREGAVLVLESLEMVLWLLSCRRNWKLANLERGPCRGGGRTGRGAWSTGVAPLLGRKQLNGIVVM